MKEKGLLIVFSGPSGSGKGTVLEYFLSMRHDTDYSVSATTRDKRPGEIDGENYHFVSKKEFKKMLSNNEILEHTEYCGNFYGTPRAKVQESIDSGRNIILEIETEGALNIKELFPQAVMIFVSAPSMRELRKRLEGRGTEDKETIERRLKRAKEEMKLINKYDYLVTNDKVERSAIKVNAIIEAERISIKRIMGGK